MTGAKTYGPAAPLSTVEETSEGAPRLQERSRHIPGRLGLRLPAQVRRVLLFLPPVLVLLLAVFAADWAEVQSGLRSDAVARERLTLYRETILRELEKHRYLPYIVARDPRAVGVLSDPSAAPMANRFLKDLAATTGADALYVMNADGLTVAASNFDTAGSFVGMNYSFRPISTRRRTAGKGASSRSAPPPASPASSSPAPRRPARRCRASWWSRSTWSGWRTTGAKPARP